MPLYACSVIPSLEPRTHVIASHKANPSSKYDRRPGRGAAGASLLCRFLLLCIGCPTPLPLASALHSEPVPHRFEAANVPASCLARIMAACCSLVRANSVPDCCQGGDVRSFHVSARGYGRAYIVFFLLQDRQLASDLDPLGTSRREGLPGRRTPSGSFHGLCHADYHEPLRRRYIWGDLSRC